MPVASDIARRISELFPGSDGDAALALVAGAKLDDGRAADPRCQRCVLVASRGSLERLIYYVSVLAIDFRDVISAGEYEVKNGELVRVRDLSQPF